MNQPLKRWLPTLSQPLLAALIGAALSYILLQLHVVVLPGSLGSAITPLVGLLVGAVVNKPKAPEVLEPPSAGYTLAGLLTEAIARTIDAHPEYLTELAQKALAAPTPKAMAQEVIASAEEAIPAVVEEIEKTTTVMPTSSAAPHITQ